MAEFSRLFSHACPSSPTPPGAHLWSFQLRPAINPIGQLITLLDRFDAHNKKKRALATAAADLALGPNE